MQSADIAPENRRVARGALKTGFDLLRVVMGTLLLVGGGFEMVRHFNPANSGMRLLLPGVAPMFFWTIAALGTGGKRPGLSLAPEYIWIPVTISVVVSAALYISLLPVFWLGPGLMISVFFSITIAFCVTTHRPEHVRLLRLPVYAGLGIMAVAWLALSLSLPAAIRQGISELAGDRPYTVYVPDPANMRTTHELVGGPDFWTFQSMFSDERILHCHMHLIVGERLSRGKHYHWSFFDGFRFVENGGGKC